MSRLNPKKLIHTFLPPTTPKSPLVPRCYTLTQSDRTGELYLTIGPEFNRKQLKGWQTRIKHVLLLKKIHVFNADFRFERG
ncbi:MAG: hypothetical protein JSW11_07225 [Candidatus Heimdallarchaeota archaeon]|nr:MAG: hypothetical protein JSW11_07225 [Candidatus Heimdallarchaeota archaeon]